MYQKNPLALVAISSAVILSGCSGNATKEGSPSDSYKLMEIYNINQKFMSEGVKPEEAKIGHRESFQNKYNNSSGRHLVNYAVGGLGGLLSNGILQSSTASSEKQDKTIVDNLTILFQLPEEVDTRGFYYDSKAEILKKAYEAHGLKVGKYKDKIGLFAEGKIGDYECKIEQRNCVLKVHYNNFFKTNPFESEPEYEEFPDAFKPVFKSTVDDSYSRRTVSFNQYIKSKMSDELLKANILGYEVDITDIIKTYHKMLAKSEVGQKVGFNLYIPGALNNGKPIVYNHQGKENYFVRKL